MKNSPFTLVPKPKQLGAADQDFLDQREKQIEQGLETFLEVGTALLEIRDYKNGVLFKERYGDFERYCRERWSIGRSQAYRWMGAAEVVKALSPIGDKSKMPLPTNEYQARALMRLKNDADQVTAWKSAVTNADGGEITGKLVGQAVREQIKLGAQTRMPERAILKGKTPPKKLEAKNLDSILRKLEKITKAAKGNKVIASLVADIEVLLAG